MRFELLPYFYSKFDVYMVHWDHAASWEIAQWGFVCRCGEFYRLFYWKKVTRWLRWLGLVNRQALGSLSLHTPVSMSGDARQQFVNRLQSEWQIRFSVGEAEECVGAGVYCGWTELDESYRVTFST